MIFVCVGSREYQFDRLIKKIDELVRDNKIDSLVFAQIGQSNYVPRYIDYKRFLSVNEFQRMQQEAQLIISHGGTGALIGALKMGKQVIAVPRLAKYGEHTDDHQLQVSNVLSEQGYLIKVEDMDEILEAILLLKEKPIIKKYNRPSNVINIINEFIVKDLRKRV